MGADKNFICPYSRIYIFFDNKTEIKEDKEEIQCEKR